MPIPPSSLSLDSTFLSPMILPAPSTGDTGRRVTRHVEKAKIQLMSRQLAMRLQYARLKVDHGWARQNLNEVENLYFHHYRRHKATAAASSALASQSSASQAHPHPAAPPSITHTSVPATPSPDTAFSTMGNPSSYYASQLSTASTLQPQATSSSLATTTPRTPLVPKHTAQANSRSPSARSPGSPRLHSSLSPSKQNARPRPYPSNPPLLAPHPPPSSPTKYGASAATTGALQHHRSSVSVLSPRPSSPSPSKIGQPSPSKAPPANSSLMFSTGPTSSSRQPLSSLSTSSGGSKSHPAYKQTSDISHISSPSNGPTSYESFWSNMKTSSLTNTKVPSSSNPSRGLPPVTSLSAAHGESTEPNPTVSTISHPSIPSSSSKSSRNAEAHAPSTSGLSKPSNQDFQAINGPNQFPVAPAHTIDSSNPYMDLGKWSALVPNRGGLHDLNEKFSVRSNDHDPITHSPEMESSDIRQVPVQQLTNINGKRRGSTAENLNSDNSHGAASRNLPFGSRPYPPSGSGGSNRTTSGVVYTHSGSSSTTTLIHPYSQQPPLPSTITQPFATLGLLHRTTPSSIHSSPVMLMGSTPLVGGMNVATSGVGKAV